MKAFQYKITDPLGIHARPAGLFVKEASGFKSDISIENGGKKADAKRILGVMGLGIKQGQEITITVDGEDEEEAVTALSTFLNSNL